MKTTLNILLVALAITQTYMVLAQSPVCNPVLPDLTVQIIDIPDNPPPPPIPPTDTDGDGLPDELEVDGDCDGDGTINVLDPDSDNDGFLDGEDACPCESGPNSENGCPPSIYDRKIEFIHGWKGNDLTWEKAANHVATEYKAITSRHNYSASEASLQDAADNLEGKIRNVFVQTPQIHRNFLIAHSQGGLVARQMGVLTVENTDIPLFSGLVTFGTPHAGAIVADNMLEHPDRISFVIEETCKALGSGPALEEVSGITVPLGVDGTPEIQLPLGRAAVAAGFASTAVEELCTAVSSIIEPTLIPLITEGIEEDLALSNAGNVPPMNTQHNAVFYGREFDDNETMYARFVGTFLKVPNDYDLWQAGQSDQLGLDQVDDVMSYYEAKYNHWSSSADSRLPLFKARSRKLAQSYQEGLNYFDRVNGYWKILIGARTAEVLPEQDCECINAQTGEVVVVDEYYCNNGTPGYPWSSCDMTISYTGNFLEYESDGFILTESAQSAPGQNYWPSRFMDGSNHMQMRNDENTRDAMKAILEEGLGRGFFKTETRQ